MLLEQYANVRTLSGKKAVVRNGYLPERDVLTAAGPVAVKVPKVRDRSGTGVKFNSSVVPPYVRKSPRVSAALPWLYLKGVSTGDMSEALSVLLGDEAKGLSANVVSRLKAHWAEEWQQWNRRDLGCTSAILPLVSNEIDLGTLACARRALSCPQSFGKYSRNAIGTSTSFCAKVSETNTWQFACLPSTSQG